VGGKKNRAKEVVATGMQLSEKLGKISAGRELPRFCLVTGACSARIGREAQFLVEKGSADVEAVG